MAHKAFSEDMAELVSAMKLAEKYSNLGRRVSQVNIPLPCF